MAGKQFLKVGTGLPPVEPPRLALVPAGPNNRRSSVETSEGAAGEWLGVESDAFEIVSDYSGRDVLRRTIGRPRAIYEIIGGAAQEHPLAPGTWGARKRPFRHQHQRDESQDRESYQQRIKGRPHDDPPWTRRGRGASIVSR